MNFLTSLLSAVSVSSLTAYGFVKYLSKKLLEQQLLKNIENYKQQLNERTEILKNELTIYANEHTVKFSRLDQKYSEIIEHIFRNITRVTQLCVRLYASTVNYIKKRETIETNDELLLHDTNKLIEYCETTRKLSILLDDNLNYLLVNEIYLCGNLYDKLWGFVTTELDMINGFKSYNGITCKEDGTIIFDDIKKQLSDYIESYKNNLKPIRILLVNEFRQILGVKL
jgi:hypothetical protein